MTLKTKTIIIESGRDKGKKFLLTEMPVAQIDNWAMRLLLALMSDGIDVPSHDPQGGMLSLAKTAFETLGKLPHDITIPLLNELLGCVEIIPDGGKPRPLALDLNDVQDFTTLWKLRKEVFQLHIDFLLPAIGQTLESAQVATPSATQT